MDRVQLLVDESPTPLIEISPWSAEDLPAFFASLLAVVTNRSDRDIVGVAAIWAFTDQSGRERRSIFLSDCFRVPNFTPIASPLTRFMLGPDAVAPESLVVGARGNVGGWVGNMSCQPLQAGTKVRLTIDAVLFGDGEMVGPDASGLAAHIEHRKPATMAVVRVVRDAQAQGQSVADALAQVISAAPPSRPDISQESLSAFNATRRIARTAQHYARDSARFEGYLRSIEALPDAIPIFRKS